MTRTSLFICTLLLICYVMLCVGCAQKSPEELYALAAEAHEAGQIDNAIKYYKKIADRYPDSRFAFKSQFMTSHLTADTTVKDISSSEEAYQEYFFNEAQQLQVDQKFEEAVTYYRKFLEEYPDSKYAYKAQFMIGFVYAEEMKDTASARKAFQKVITDYEENDLTDDAKWMIENLDKGPEEIITGEGEK